MPVIESRLNTRDAAFAQNRDAMAALVADLREKLAVIEQGGGAAPSAKHTARGKLLPRERVRALLDVGQPVPRILAARRLRDVPGQHRRGGHHHRHRARQRAGMRDRLQRRHGQGRHLLSAHREETSAGAGHRARKQPAVHLPRRLRRREPAQPVRRVSRPRPLRAHLLQPGDDVGAGHPAGRGGDGLVHGGRRLRAGDVGRVDHRARAGDDLPGRPAAGEGRDRRNRQRGGPGRRRRAHARLGRRRPLRAERSSRAGDRAQHRRQPESREAGGARRAAAGRAAAIRPRKSTASSRPTSRSPTTCAR